MEQIVLGNVRVQLLSERIVRIEYDKNASFFDGDTFFIPNRGQFLQNRVAYSQSEGLICFGDYELYVPQNAKSLSQIKLEKNGKKVYSFKKLCNSGELPALDKTPEVFALSDTPRIIVPNGGYSVRRYGEYSITENVQDIYLLLCNKSAKLLRRLYVELTGRCELVRLSTLGSWNSKYYAYTEQEAKQLILDYEKHQVPLDVMVIDTDWRSSENGWGYDVNEKLFPDMKRFLDFAHEHGVEVMFNDHPEPVNGAHVFEANEIAYREKNLQSLMEKGLDIWWYDRNWYVHLESPTNNVRYETFGLYLFADITRNHYQKVANNQDIYRRPVIMGNVVNIASGYFDKIYDSASHRYSIQWTGDVDSSPSSLAQEVANMIRAGNDCIAYCNADCGGHLGNPEKEGFIRWMQFGTLSPVFRPHCACTVKRWRDPWSYDDETLDIVREYNNLRYRLLPVIYKNAYNNYVTGEPIFKSLAYEYPNDSYAAKLFNEYMLGNDLLIKPVVGEITIAVDERYFTRPVNAVYYNGTDLQGEPIAQAKYNKLNIILNHTSPEKNVPVYNFSARFETKVKFDTDKKLFLRSDDGATVWINGKKVHEDRATHPAMVFPLGLVEKDKEYDVKIEYFQAGGEAVIGLYCQDAYDDGVTQAYLPNGKWLNLFDGSIYDGESIVKGKYKLREMPLFVRMGAIIPLAYNAKNTKEQKWDELVFDFYPCKQASDEGYLYEDDVETTAYKLEQFRKSSYSAHYSEEENAFVVTFCSGEGTFDVQKCFCERKIALKVHLAEIKEVKRITVNSKEVNFKLTQKADGIFPLSTGDASADSDTVVVKTIVRTDEDCVIKLYL